jgi:dienelactone hydrolase
MLMSSDGNRVGDVMSDASGLSRHSVDIAREVADRGASVAASETAR